MLRIGLRKKDKFPQEIDEHRIGDVAVILHYLFIHRYNQERIARTVTCPRLQDAVVKVIRGCGGIIGMPFRALRVDVVDGCLQLVPAVEFMLLSRQIERAVSAGLGLSVGVVNQVVRDMRTMLCLQ